MNSLAYLPVSSVLTALLLIGGVGLACTAWQWAYVGRQVSDVAVKVTATLVKYVAGLASFGGAYAAAPKDDWWYPAAMGLATIVVWDVLEKLIDNRVKAADKFDKQALVDAKQALVDAESECERALAVVQGKYETLGRHLAVLRKSVTEKTIRLMAKMSERRERPSVVLIRSALTPRNHLDELLQALTAFASEQVPKERKEICNFRVGLYVDHGGVMMPLCAVNLNDRSYDVFRSYATNEASFRLAAGESAAHVVTCANNGKSVIVEDCVEAAVRGKFQFFSDNQRSYLRSMLAYYVGTVYHDDGTTAVAVIVIDTDLAGHFREADRDFLEFWLREFGTRIKLELLLHSMLVTRGAKT